MLPPLDDPHPLPEATIRSFREQGHGEPGDLAAGPLNPVLWRRDA
jgi:hypothetical protein